MGQPVGEDEEKPRVDGLSDYNRVISEERANADLKGHRAGTRNGEERPDGKVQQPQEQRSKPRRHPLPNVSGIISPYQRDGDDA